MPLHEPRSKILAITNPPGLVLLMS
uniref:Uncharacterized protein n=1 Tax=Rhizophora mucronata TaxID=61149 RepID=A0A2P2NI77_RHIMU